MGSIVATALVIVYIALIVLLAYVVGFNDLDKDQ